MAESLSTISLADMEKFQLQLIRPSAKEPTVKDGRANQLRVLEEAVKPPPPGKTIDQ